MLRQAEPSVNKTVAESRRAKGSKDVRSGLDGACKEAASDPKPKQFW